MECRVFRTWTHMTRILIATILSCFRIWRNKKNRDKTSIWLLVLTWILLFRNLKPRLKGLVCCHHSWARWRELWQPLPPSISLNQPSAFATTKRRALTPSVQTNLSRKVSSCAASAKQTPFTSQPRSKTASRPFTAPSQQGDLRETSKRRTCI